MSGKNIFTICNYKNIDTTYERCRHCQLYVPIGRLEKHIRLDCIYNKPHNSIGFSFARLGRKVK